MNKVYVCGSIAYDHIMDFPGYFKEHVMPDKIDSINLSFLVNSLKKLKGGTGPNISYNLSLVGLKPYLVGSAGMDFGDYGKQLGEYGVDVSNVNIIDNDYTASCFIVTDMNNNQIISFYPGAMKYDTEISLKTLGIDDSDLVVIVPTEPLAMAKWALECREMGVPYLFDPGMQIPRLDAGQLMEGIMGAKVAVFNEYEFSMLSEKTKLKKEDILKYVDLLVITLGNKGSELCRGNESVHVKCARPECEIDPTGAGDAYRAGLLKGYFEGASLERMGQYGSTASVYVVEKKGATEHSYNIEDFMKRYKENFVRIAV